MKNLGLQSLSINDVQLDEGNPRIKHYIEMYGQKVSAAQIALALSYTGEEGSTTFNALRESIRVSGGIIHPIIVSKEDDNYFVIEGNTRLQIYKEFDSSETEGDWSHIPSLVYEGMTEIDKHEIRLQSHLVGPRSWDAYSKAKYLYQLSQVECLPIEKIISMCGGNKKQVMESIGAYKCMHEYYEKIMKSRGAQMNLDEYSKFVEYSKNKNAKNALLLKGYSDEDFATWVADRKISLAADVRSIPDIFKNPEALAVFMKYNTAEAKKIVAAENISTDIDWDKVPYELLCRKLSNYLDRIEFKELKHLANNPSFDSKKTALFTLMDNLKEVIEEIQELEE